LFHSQGMSKHEEEGTKILSGGEKRLPNIEHRSESMTGTHEQKMTGAGKKKGREKGALSFLNGGSLGGGAGKG